MQPTLLEQIAAGDRDAVSQFIDRYGGLIWTLARRLNPGGDDHEDAVQEIFIDLWKNADRFRPDKGEEAVFVAMIARRRLIDRRRSHDRAPDTASIEALAELGAPGAAAEQSADAAKAMDALKSLQPEQQRMLTLSLKWGMSHGEIAEVTKTAVGTVKTNIRRGLIALRQRLQAGSDTVTRREA